jgi:hypothetical protein
VRAPWGLDVIGWMELVETRKGLGPGVKIDPGHLNQVG